MKDHENEVQEAMTNNQAIGLIEAIKIIAEKAETTEEIKDALGRIQDAMKTTK